MPEPQTPDQTVTGAPETPQNPAQPVETITLKTPVIQVAGGQRYQIMPETTADQVKFGDGSDAQTRITTLEKAVSGQTSNYIKDNIADRDAMTALLPGDQCWVLDATADPTVEKGGAKYLYMMDNTWLKIGEAESLDLILDWSLIQNRPQSTVADIDLAVAKQHTHTNIETLSHLSDDGAGNLLFKGKRINDGLMWSCLVDGPEGIPANLADGGLVFYRKLQNAGADAGADTGADAGNPDQTETVQP